MNLSKADFCYHFKSFLQEQQKNLDAKQESLNTRHLFDVVKFGKILSKNSETLTHLKWPYVMLGCSLT